MLSPATAPETGVDNSPRVSSLPDDIRTRLQTDYTVKDNFNQQRYTLSWEQPRRLVDHPIFQAERKIKCLQVQGFVDSSLSLAEAVGR